MPDTILTNAETVKSITDQDNANVMHPWQAMSDEDANLPIAAGGEGIYLFDPQGRRLIDGPAGMWCVQIGYGRKEMGEAIGEQATKLAYKSPWSFASEPSAVLAGKLAKMAPGDLNSVFFTTGGSTAVDSAMRFVQFYNNVMGRPDKKLIISRERAYHGSTYLSASVSGKERDRNLMDLETKTIRFLPDVNPYLRPDGMSVEAWCDAKVADLEAMIQKEGPDKVGAFIAEPILASGGVIVPPPGYHTRTLEVCRKHDIIYISDEVVTSFGRLGHWFASKDVFDIEPDIITTAKGLTSGYLPLGAMIVSERLLDNIKNASQGEIMFSNGYTYTGHPVSCAAALKNIEIFETDNLLEHVRAITPLFQSRLRDLMKYDIIGDARGVGLIGCLEGSGGEGLSGERKLAIDKKFGMRIDAACEAMGLTVRPLANMCVFSPPLIITEEQITEMFDILERAIVQVEKEFL